MHPTKFRYIWPSSFRGEDFLKQANQKQELPVVAMFVNGSERHKQSQQRTFHRCFLTSFGTFGQTVSEEKNFLNQLIRDKNHLWWPCLLMDRDGMSNLYREPPIKNRPIRNKNCLWRPCLLTDRDEKNNEGLPQMLPTKFQFIWPRSFRGIFICNSIHC